MKDQVFENIYNLYDNQPIIQKNLFDQRKTDEKEIRKLKREIERQTAQKISDLE